MNLLQDIPPNGLGSRISSIFESDNKRYIIMQHTSENISFYSKLGEIAEKLKSVDFLHIHKSFW